MVKKTWWLYTLELENSKYYVGTTSQKNPYTRINQHGKFASASWTRLHKPLQTIELVKLGEISRAEAEKIETKKTREYMKKYGLDNVRGGDISITEPITAKLGNIYEVKDWNTIKIIIILLVIIIVLGLLDYA